MRPQKRLCHNPAMTNSMPLWEQRFRAPQIAMFDWHPNAPDCIVYLSNESGVWQIHSRDHETGDQRQISESAVGVVYGLPSLDGKEIAWFEDETGDESGRWLVQRFTGGPIHPFLEGLPIGWNEGLALAPGVVAAGISNEKGFGIYVSLDGGPARLLYESPEAVRIASADAGMIAHGGLSSDGSLLCLEHSEHGDLLHPALRIVDPKTGDKIAEELDEGLALAAVAWAPVAGDHRLAIVHEREGERRPGVWNPAAGERTDIHVDLDGVVDVAAWWPDGRSLLLNHLYEGRHGLFRYDLENGALTPLTDPDGTIETARVRPDGGVWYLQSRGNRGPMVLDQSRAEVLSAEGDKPPPGRPYESWYFNNPHGQRVHAFYVRPEGDGPFPVIMFVHGGPTAADTDAWYPQTQAYVDAGFVVGMVNYRGSTGYGREWRDALIGNIGGPEIEDVNAGLDDLVTRGIADPERAVIAGWSWGGYITLLELGKHPELWTCGLAGIPVGDYEASYEDLSPLLAAYDRALLGGTPQEVPELMRDRNPIYFVDHVQAPVLFVAGENDSRCPLRQVLLYVDKLKERNHPHEVYLFSTGHGSFDTEERVRQMRITLRFLADHVPGIDV
jgi:dipeptidyl aminopeptidase/acylaminoacyl peptidase